MNKNLFSTVLMDFKIMEKNDDNSMWFEVHEICDDAIHAEIFSNLPYQDCPNAVIMYLFSEKSVPSFLSTIAGRG